MKNLTAGIFIVLMGLVSVDAMGAFVASKDYVDTKAATLVNESAQALQGEINALETTVGTLPQGTDATSVVDYVNKKTEGIATDDDVAENAEAIAALELLVGDTSVADQIAAEIKKANLSQYATQESVSGALTAYANLKALAYKDAVDTDDIVDGAVTTAKLDDGAVTKDKLGAGAVTDAAVEDGALSQGKIDGLDATLAEKMDITTQTTTAGKYVLTANVDVNGVADYAWESIER
ncbi:MAG: hypothetical protein IIV74_01685 [Alphaproteobacteria bacterium]|nr:hypothetical protein [Alphaproteobacteria bacterium]